MNTLAITNSGRGKEHKLPCISPFGTDKSFSKHLISPYKSEGAFIYCRNMLTWI